MVLQYVVSEYGIRVWCEQVCYSMVPLPHEWACGLWGKLQVRKHCIRYRRVKLGRNHWEKQLISISKWMDEKANVVRSYCLLWYSIHHREIWLRK